MTFSIWTLGCKLNQAESESIANSFVHNGFVLTQLENTPDIVIVNSCTVTSKAEQKARRVLRNLVATNKNSAIILTGCYAEVDGENLKKKIPGILVLSLRQKSRLLQLPDFYRKNIELFVSPKKIVEYFLSSMSPENSDPFAFEIDSMVYKTRAFLKIEDGCNNSCTYCRVTIARGSAVSLNPEIVKERVVNLEKNGFAEVVLTGVNISMYNYNGVTLGKLIDKILKATVSIRVRLSSIEPDFIDDDFLSVIKNDRVCSHFHLPIQSGSDKVLSLMDRHYKSSEVKTVIKKLLAAKPDSFLSADVIVGFNSETEEDFLDTYNLINSCGFTFVHVFPYSPRPSTKAFNFKDSVPERIRDERSARLRQLSDNLFMNYKKKYEKKEVEIVVEEIKNIDGVDYAIGLTSNYLKSISIAPKNCIMGKKIKTFYKSY